MEVNDTEFEFAVIGGGMAGLPIANKLAYKNHRTVLIEKGDLGGTCLNRGCIPTKTMLYSAKVAHLVRRAHEFGIETNPPKINLPKIVERKNRIVDGIRSGSIRQIDRNKNLELIRGAARFVSDRQIQVGERLITANRIIINVGAKPHLPDIAGLGNITYHTSTSLLDATAVPDSLLVIGGGYVGVEFAQMFARFGSKVTIVQRGSQLVAGEESEIGASLCEALTDEGIDIYLNSTVERVTANSANDILADLVSATAEKSRLSVGAVLVATGRTPNTADLGLETARVDLDERGFIPIDARFRTNREHIFAIGDVTGRAMFTHAARDDADVLYRSLIKGEDLQADTKLISHAVFTDPEIASVGLAEAQARESGYSVKIGKQPFSGVARAKAIGEEVGFIKIVADANTDHILGAHIIGPEAGNLLHEITVAMEAGITFQRLADMIHIHPTLAEGVNSAAGGVHRPVGEGS